MFCKVITEKLKGLDQPYSFKHIDVWVRAFFSSSNENKKKMFSLKQSSNEKQTTESKNN